MGEKIRTGPSAGDGQGREEKGKEGKRREEERNIGFGNTLFLYQIIEALPGSALEGVRGEFCPESRITCTHVPRCVSVRRCRLFGVMFLGLAQVFQRRETDEVRFTQVHTEIAALERRVILQYGIGFFGTVIATGLAVARIASL